VLVVVNETDVRSRPPDADDCSTLRCSGGRGREADADGSALCAYIRRGRGR